jgi:acetyltransferase
MMTPSMAEHQTHSLRGGIRPLLFPGSIAIVGASERNLRPIENAARGAARVALVNPTRPEVAGLPCFPSVSDLHEIPELVLALVSHARVESAVADALDAGVRSFVVPGIGAEAGADGPEVARRVVSRLEEAAAAGIGPNCMGVARPDGASTWIGTVPVTFLPGRVSAVVQSGSIGEALIACGPRIGFRTVISSGGEMSRDAADLVGFLAEDDGTQVVALFLETVRRPAAFATALARCAEAEKPVVCLKVGRSEAAARATLAHTGALVGSARAFSALLRAYGAIEVDDFHDLLETLEVLGRRRRPPGRRIAAVSESGGECALLADHAAAAGIPFEPLPADLAARLTADFPNYVAPQNPLDAWAIDDAAVVYPRSLELLAESGEYDILLGQVDLSQYRGADEGVWCELVVRSLAQVTKGTDIFPAVTSVHTSDPPPAIAAVARELDVALLRGPGHALRALAAVAGWQPRVPDRTPGTRPAVRPLDTGGALPELESSLLLGDYGVPFPARRRAASPEEAAAAASELTPPFVVKVDGPAHKSAGGGVVLGLETPEAVLAAAKRLGGRVLVAEQVAAGPEAFCGLTRDPDYGPVLAVGLGGVAVEALSLAAVALAPLDRRTARSLVDESPGLARVASDAALETLAETLVGIGRLAVDHPEVDAVDVNPLILSAEGAIAVDALVIVRKGS